MDEETKQAIRNLYPVGSETQRLINLCTFDLLWGPIGCDDGRSWPGFAIATRLISEALDSVSDVYVDTFAGYASESEPEGFEDEESGEWIDPCWEDFYHAKRSEVLGVLCGRHLAHYV